MHIVTFDRTPIVASQYTITLIQVCKNGMSQRVWEKYILHNTKLKLGVFEQYT